MAQGFTAGLNLRKFFLGIKVTRSAVVNKQPGTPEEISKILENRPFNIRFQGGFSGVTTEGRDLKLGFGVALPLPGSLGVEVEFNVQELFRRIID